LNQLPEIELLESEEYWSQRAIDTPKSVLEELNQLREQQSAVDVTQSSTATELVNLNK
jgi:hypothetical protein